MASKQKHPKLHWIKMRIEMWVIFPVVYEFLLWLAARTSPYNSYSDYVFYTLWALRLLLWAMGIYGLLKIFYRVARWLLRK